VKLPRLIAARLSSRPIFALVVLAIVSELAYLSIAIAGQSLHVEGAGKHSLLGILALFGLAFTCYLFAIPAALAARQDRRLIGLIVIAALTFRITLLLSNPIEEIDLYRYLWDGQSTVAGVNPFRFSPQQVLAAETPTDLPADLARLVKVREGSRDMPQILERIHYGELPTIYPPTSQAVFALAALCTPRAATVVARMTIMKAWFVGFDLITLALVVLLLRWVGKPVGWSLAYAWCPLLIKEVANSGHLDALAVCLTTLAIYLAVKALFPRWTVLSQSVRPAVTICLAAGVLGLAIGAKLYPVVLVPLLFCTTWRRLGWQVAMASSIVGGLVTACVLSPMLPRNDLAELAPIRISATSADAPPLPPPELGTEPRDPSQSLRAFLSEWEMNDFLFLLVMENIRPTHQLPSDEVAWFSFIPEHWRVATCDAVAELTGLERGRAPFFISRAVTSLIFLALALWLALHGAASSSAGGFLEAAFLTVAWFWLLLPTQNPWYWTWALPLLPFARGRAWLAVSGLALLYYFRFWLAHYYLSNPVLGTNYKGPQFFDYVVTWLEFGPWLCVLMLAAAARARATTRETDPSTLKAGGWHGHAQHAGSRTTN
jgi:hypothetical protein